MGHIGLQKSTFSEHGHVAYQIEGNEAYNNILANILPLHTSLVPGLGSNGHFSYVACQINGKEAENTMQANIIRFNTHTVPRWGQKVKHFCFTSN